MKFQDDISNMNTYIRTYIHTDKPKPICPPPPPLFQSWGHNEILLLEDFPDYNRFPKFQPIDDRLHVNERFSIIIDHRNNTI